MRFDFAKAGVLVAGVAKATNQQPLQHVAPLLTGGGARDTGYGIRDTGLGTRGTGHGIRGRIADCRLLIVDCRLARGSGLGTRDLRLRTPDPGLPTLLHLFVLPPLGDEALHHPAGDAAVLLAHAVAEFRHAWRLRAARAVDGFRRNVELRHDAGKLAHKIQLRHVFKEAEAGGEPTRRGPPAAVRRGASGFPARPFARESARRPARPLPSACKRFPCRVWCDRRIAPATS